MLRDVPAFSGFSVKDLGVAKQFYSDVLGLNVEDGEMGLRLKLASGNDIFVYAKEDHIPATYTILNFSVEDIDKAVDELTAKEVKFEHYEMPPTDDKGVARGLEANRGPNIAWFKDPFGNIFSVLQDK
jgi:catechol 2,3-dioxygenase-like lactoylglutathione lyase family enzyme